MLTLNSHSLAVSRLQMQLRQTGDYKGIITGFFDNSVREAAISFQRKNGLQADGIVGPRTQTAINAICANGFHLLFIHVSATPEGRDTKAAQIVQFHTLPVSKGGRGWSRPGYADVIELNGNLVNIFPYNDDNLINSWEETWGVNGATLLNRNARHVCLIGGMTVDLKAAKDTRTAAQTQTLTRYVLNHIADNPNIVIAGHNQVQNKACPCFDVPKWLRCIGVSDYNIAMWPERLRLNV